VSLLLNLNYDLFQEINNQVGQNQLLDALMIFCADGLIFCFPLLLLFLWGRPLIWRRRPLQPGEADVLHASRVAVLWAAIACLLAYALNLLVESFVFEPRPFVSHKVHLLIAHARDASFPSDHAAWAFAVVGVLMFSFLPALVATWRKHSDRGSAWLPVPLLLMIIVVVIACSIGFARIYVGVHYPGDILGGAVDGLIAGLVVAVLQQWLHRLTDNVLQFANKLHLA
jgi:undecaprenyl-diphosphatase